MPYRPATYRPPRITPEESARAINLIAPVASVPEAKPKRQAPTGRASNARRGLRLEGEAGGKGAAAVLRREGWEPQPRAGSIGVYDVLGLKADKTQAGPLVRRVQVKSQGGNLRFRPDGCNDAVRHWLGLGRYQKRWDYDPDASREVWLYHGQTLVAVVVLGEGDVVTASGDRGQEVQQAINRMLEKERIHR